MARQSRSTAELQEICLHSLKQCPGFEQIHEIVVQPRESEEGFANWTLAAVRPRVDNKVLRAARLTIQMLQQTYDLEASRETLHVVSKRGSTSPKQQSFVEKEEPKTSPRA